MRGSRIKDEGEAYYHMISRVVDRRMLFEMKDYVDGMFQRFRSRFGEKRQTGVARRSVEHGETRRLAARPMRGGCYNCLNPLHFMKSNGGSEPRH